MFEMMPFVRRGVSNYNPFHEFEEMERNFFHSNSLAEFKTDIQDKGDHYELIADLPGFRREDISLELNGNMLTVSAERHSDWENKESQDTFVRCERSYGCYRRSYDVTGVDTDRIQAGYQDGVLTLQLPKKNASAPSARRIEIR